MFDNQIKERLQHSPVVPIIIPGVSFHSVEEAVAVAKALKQGGVLILEILVRGDTVQQRLATEAIRAIHQDTQTQDMILCAGTINHSDKMDAAVKAGAHFMVSADAQTDIITYWQQYHSSTPFAPTGFTTTEIANLLAITPVVKLFPTNQLAQKRSYLNSLTAIYVQKGSLLLSYDVTEPANILDLQHPIVAGIAAAWMAPAALIQKQQWATLTQISELTVIAARQAREKQFHNLNESIAQLCVLAQLEPAQKEQSIQTDTPALSDHFANFWTNLSQNIDEVSQRIQNHCTIM